jgi:alkanesulfonate monooxygenase SsuD/methylene tetrahydromethanopterin reductase-like flavin-dependent oxidoreductase (luciferase family)
MHVSYFTERPYRWLDEDLVLAHRSFFGISNAHFDAARAAEDYNAYLDEFVAAEELGFDGVVLNEHHGNPYCMGNVMNLEAGILARITDRVNIVLVGNPLPALRHPLRTAEELAEIDLISRGRLVSGFVRGAGSEQFFNNVNPAYNREMFEEAHDFIVQAWTKPGPWRYEGEHYHYRHVNPWALPYQKPHPLIVVPGVLSAETARWCAERAYPYIGLGTALGPTADLWDMYADRAAEVGYQAGPENFGYLIGVGVADTEEKAQQIGEGFIFGGGQGAFARTEWAMPPGYNSKDSIRRLARSPGGAWLGISPERLKEAQVGHDLDNADLDFDMVRTKLRAGYKKAQDSHTLLIGTPEQVIEKAKVILEVLRPGMFVMMNVQGPISHEDRRRSQWLMANEVVPEIRAHADRLGLDSPFEVPPGSNRLTDGERRQSVADRRPLEALQLI